MGAIAGGVIGATVGTTPGRASFVGWTALWTGVVSGLAVNAFTTESSSGQAPLLAAGIGINAGALAGILAAGPVSPSIARVRFLDLGAIGGGLLVGGLYFAAANAKSTEQAASAATAIGVAGGLAAAWAATASMPIDSPEDRAAAESKPASWSPTLMPTKDGMMIVMQGAI